MPRGREGAVLANVIFFGKHMLACFFPFSCFLLIAMDEQLLHILVPVHGGHAPGKVFHARLHKSTLGLPTGRDSLQIQIPQFHRVGFFLHSNTICLCLLNLGVGHQPAIPVPHLAELQQLPLSTANTKFCAAPQRKETRQNYFAF